MRRLSIVLLSALCACSSGTGSTSTTEAAAVPDIDRLTTEWGCGHGFWLSDPEQTVALRLSYHGDMPPPEEATLPHPDWSVSLTEGRDLFANWCDDVIEQGEPTPIETRKLDIVGGNLRIVGEVPEDYTGGALELVAADLVVELEDTTKVELGSIEITNPNWGFFAG